MCVCVCVLSFPFFPGTVYPGTWSVVPRALQQGLRCSPSSIDEVASKRLFWVPGPRRKGSTFLRTREACGEVIAGPRLLSTLGAFLTPSVETWSSAACLLGAGQSRGPLTRLNHLLSGARAARHSPPAPSPCLPVAKLRDRHAFSIPVVFTVGISLESGFVLQSRCKGSLVVLPNDCFVMCTLLGHRPLPRVTFRFHAGTRGLHGLRLRIPSDFRLRWAAAPPPPRPSAQQLCPAGPVFLDICSEVPGTAALPASCIPGFGENQLALLPPSGPFCDSACIWGRSRAGLSRILGAELLHRELSSGSGCCSGGPQTLSTSCSPPPTRVFLQISTFWTAASCRPAGRDARGGAPAQSFPSPNGQGCRAAPSLCTPTPGGDRRTPSSCPHLPHPPAPAPQGSGPFISSQPEVKVLLTAGLEVLVYGTPTPTHPHTQMHTYPPTHSHKHVYM